MRLVRTVCFFRVPTNDAFVGAETREHRDPFTGANVCSTFMTAPWLTDLDAPSAHTYGIVLSVPKRPSFNLADLDRRTTRWFDLGWLEGLFGDDSVELLGEDVFGGSCEGADANGSSRRQVFRISPSSVDALASDVRSSTELASVLHARALRRGADHQNAPIARDDVERAIEELRAICGDAGRAGDAMLVLVQ